jgi:GMP synthase (glutamine-hydrolysing)
VLEKILILDFGSQYTQLIARKVRELNVYCEIHPFNKIPVVDGYLKGVILSGSPCSVRDAGHPEPVLDSIKGHLPILGICYGAQYLAQKFGGEVLPSKHREYGRANLETIDQSSLLFQGIYPGSQVWMSHGDTIVKLPEDFKIIGSTHDVKAGAFQVNNEKTYGYIIPPMVYNCLKTFW